jgi:hypothetical protein
VISNVSYSMERLIALFTGVLWLILLIWFLRTKDI